VPPFSVGPGSPRKVGGIEGFDPIGPGSLQLVTDCAREDRERRQPAGSARYRTAPEAPSPAGAREGVADVTERLLAEFGGERDLAAIAAVVLGCRAELVAVPAGALPEALERLARQRLQDHQPVGEVAPRRDERPATR
jgi:hypothetical protein